MVDRRVALCQGIQLLVDISQPRLALNALSNHVVIQQGNDSGEYRSRCRSSTHDGVRSYRISNAAGATALRTENIAIVISGCGHGNIRDIAHAVGRYPGSRLPGRFRKSPGTCAARFYTAAALTAARSRERVINGSVVPRDFWNIGKGGSQAGTI